MVLRRLRAPKRKRGKPRILICTPEITELPEGMGNAAHYIRAKGGGLGDISASLINYLHSDERFEMHVVLPKYDSKIQDFAAISERELDLLAPLLHRRGVHLVVDSAFSHLPDVYADTEGHPRIRRAEALQRYIINQLLDELRPDVVHCNDWMTALVPAAARDKGIKSLFTLHNVFTEKETPANVDRSGIDVRRFMNFLYFDQFPHNSADNWFNNRIDFTASAINAADWVNTVSHTFLDEMVRGQFDDIVPNAVKRALIDKREQGRALGILNAPNDNIDPRVCSHITRYGIEDVAEKKRINKELFQKRMKLAPDLGAALFFWPSRLYSQKGPELLYTIVQRFVRKHGAQVAVVANGAPDIEQMFKKLAAGSTGRIAVVPFSEELSDLGKAAADFILMPSYYEPCGLPQMEGPRFGALPVARLTGGLRDTVTELDVEANTGNGFAFEEFNSTALEAALHRAVAFHQLPAEKKTPIVQRIMREGFERFALANTAKEYVALYEKMIG
jgi:starch synthase